MALSPPLPWVSKLVIKAMASKCQLSDFLFRTGATLSMPRFKRRGILNGLFLCVLALMITCYSYAKVYTTAEESIKKIFLASQTVETKEIKLTEDKKKNIEKRLGCEISETSFVFYIGKTKEEINGYSIVLNETGKHGSITFIITINPDGKIKDIAVLESREVKGAKIAKKRFLRQFIGKSLKDPLRLRKDIDAVTGATISSNAATRAARKALVIYEELKGDLSE